MYISCGLKLLIYKRFKKCTEKICKQDISTRKHVSFSKMKYLLQKKNLKLKYENV